MKRRPVGVPWWGEVCLSVRTPWDRAYSPGVLSCIGALARAPARELMRKSEGCWCQGGPLWLAETLCFTYPLSLAGGPSIALDASPMLAGAVCLYRPVEELDSG